MRTVIDNNQRVFQVVTSTGKQAFCNLTDLNKVVAELDTNPDYFVINHVFNNSLHKMGKKALRDMFAAHRIKMEFVY